MTKHDETEYKTDKWGKNDEKMRNFIKFCKK